MLCDVGRCSQLLHLCICIRRNVASLLESFSGVEHWTDHLIVWVGNETLKINLTTREAVAGPIAYLGTHEFLISKHSPRVYTLQLVIMRLITRYARSIMRLLSM